MCVCVCVWGGGYMGHYGICLEKNAPVQEDINPSIYLLD